MEVIALVNISVCRVCLNHSMVLPEPLLKPLSGLQACSLISIPHR